MNVSVISGRLTDEPQIKKTTNGDDMAVFTVAINEGYGDNKRTLYVDVTAFKNAANVVSRYGKKGLRIIVRGRIDISYYMKGDEKRKSFRIVAESVDIIDWPERKEIKEDDTPYKEDETPYENLPF